MREALCERSPLLEKLFVREAPCQRGICQVSLMQVKGLHSMLVLVSRISAVYINFLQSWPNVYVHLVERIFIHIEMNHTHLACVSDLFEYFKMHVEYFKTYCLVLFKVCHLTYTYALRGQANRKISVKLLSRTVYFYIRG